MCISDGSCQYCTTTCDLSLSVDECRLHFSDGQCVAAGAVSICITAEPDISASQCEETAGGEAGSVAGEEGGSEAEY